MAYSGSCLCENVKFSFEFDPMMQFQCHCTTCQKVFGTTLNALAMPEAELIHEGEMKRFTITGGSGNALHYNYCPNFSHGSLSNHYSISRYKRTAINKRVFFQKWCILH